MSHGISDLDRLERDAFRKFYEDGLFDIFLGSMMLVLGASALVTDWFADEVAGYVAMLALGFAVTVPLLVVRRRLLRARLGTFEPGPRRRRRIAGTRGVLFVSLLVGLVAFGLAAVAFSAAPAADIAEVLLPVVWFVNAVVVFGLMAYLLDVPRFYVYGVLFGLVMPLLMWPDALWGMDPSAWAVLGVLGLAVIAVGLYKLRHFLRRYPPVEIS